jgi:hypothetical protein
MCLSAYDVRYGCTGVLSVHVRNRVSWPHGPASPLSAPSILVCSLPLRGQDDSNCLSISLPYGPTTAVWLMEPDWSPAWILANDRTERMVSAGLSGASHVTSLSKIPLVLLPGEESCDTWESRVRDGASASSKPNFGAMPVPPCTFCSQNSWQQLFPSKPYFAVWRFDMGFAPSF